VEKALQAKGESVPRPNYDSQSSSSHIVKDEDEEDNDEKPVATEGASSSRLDGFKYTKQNHEATSDEGE